jgi:hypothetical protein
MNTFKCIKPSCDKSYETEETEAYYCPSCVTANKVLAKQIDAQVASRPSKRSTRSALQEYEAQLKANPVKGGGLLGVKISI